MSDDIILQYLQSIEGKIDSLKEDLAPRVNKVELWQANAQGKITATGLIGVALGGIITYLTNIIKH